MLATLGPELYDVLYEPYAQKLWGRSGGEIDIEQARRRVSADSPWKIARRMLRRGDPQGRVFHYPRRGFGQIVDALAAAAPAAGASLHTDAEISSVELRGARPIVRRADGTGIRAGHVLSTVPMPVLAGLARPQPSPAVLDDARRLTLRAMVLVYLVHRGGRWTEYDAHYLPAGDTPLTRVSEPANYRDSPEDPTDALSCVRRSRARRATGGGRRTTPNSPPSSPGRWPASTCRRTWPGSPYADCRTSTRSTRSVTRSGWPACRDGPTAWTG